MQLTRKQTKETKELFKRKKYYKFVPSTTSFEYLPLKSKKNDPAVFYELNFRIVRFKVTDELYETVLTNLDKDVYPPEKLRELYASRWGIETSFRDLKYTVGRLDFHSKKVMCIHTSHIVIEKKQRKYTYKANFSIAAHMCRLFYRGKATSPNLETIIARHIIPVRNDRHRKRNLTIKVFHGFLYRIA